MVHQLLVVGFAAVASRSHVNRFVGVSEAGLEFGDNKFPGIPFKDYTQPTNDSVAFFADAKFNLIRLPFVWERLQPVLKGPLDEGYAKLIDEVVQTVLSHEGMSILLDVHNYARYRGSVIGESGGNVTASDFADLWSRIAKIYSSTDKNSPILFGLMNEPHNMKTTTILANSNAAIAAIRTTGARNLITVCGNSYSGAHAWFEGGNDSNAAVMGGIVDPADNFMAKVDDIYRYEMHQYLDADNSGQHPNCTLTNASNAMSAATGWLRQQGKSALLGEFAGANNAPCHEGVDSMLSFVANNKDVWQGWVWWAAGPWWGDYMFSLEPNKPCPPRDQPQEAWLLPFVDGNKTDRFDFFRRLVASASEEEIAQFRKYLDQY